MIGSVSCANAGLVEGVNCNTIAGQGLNIGSPLTIGLGKQDLTYINSSTPGVGSGLSNVPDITQYTISNPTTAFQTVQWPPRRKRNQQGSHCFCHLLGAFQLPRLNGGLGYQLFHHDQINDAFSVIWDHTFSPTFLNEARANAAGWR